MWARQLGLRPGLGPDAMLSLQRGCCRCLKCTFCMQHDAQGGKGRMGRADWSVWVAGVVEKILELHFKWIDGRRGALQREGSSRSCWHNQNYSQVEGAAVAGNRERGTGARARAIARVRAIMEGSFGPKNRIEQRMWGDIWRCLDNPWKSTCVCLCVCVRLLLYMCDMRD